MYKNCKIIKWFFILKCIKKCKTNIKKSENIKKTRFYSPKKRPKHGDAAKNAGRRVGRRDPERVAEAVVLAVVERGEGEEAAEANRQTVADLGGR
jgi:hypothetical protein